MACADQRLTLYARTRIHTARADRSFPVSSFLAWQLTGLKKLRLQNNKFERLPADLAQLLSLEELNIGQNPLMDVPPVLCTLPVLRVMQVPRTRAHTRSLPRTRSRLSCFTVCTSILH